MNTLLFLCEYMGPYPGNFIPSLIALQTYVESQERENTRVIYAFPKACSDYEWAKQMSEQSHIIYYYESGNIKKQIAFIESIIIMEKITAVHTHFEAMDRALMLVKILHPSLVIIKHIHSDFSNGVPSKHRILKNVYHVLEEKFKTAISVSKAMQRRNGYYVPNALATDRIPIDIQSNKDYLRNTLGFQTNDIIVITFGWSPITKGIDIACKMLDQLPDNYRDRVRLCIVSPNNNSCKEFINELKTETKDRITILKPMDEVFLYHVSADVFLSASRSEGFSYSILEALAVGTPVVTSNIPGTVWSLSYENVYPFMTENPKDCAHAIVECILGRNDAVNSLVAERVREDYSIDKWCSKIYEIYKSINVFGK